jgi:hypothetical protein
MKKEKSMKKILAAVCVALFAASLVLASCGGGGGGRGPQGLAKEAYQMSKESATLESSGPKYDAFMKRFAEHSEKVKALSEEDQAAYQAEVRRLREEGK